MKKRKVESTKRAGLFERILRYFLRKVGRLVGRYPWHSIILCLLIFAGLSYGLIRLNTKMRTIELVKPYNSKSSREQELIEDYFPSNYSTEFDIGRAARFDRYAQVFILAKDGGSMLRKRLFDEIILLDRIIHNVSITWQGTEYYYKEICAKNKGSCFKNEVLDFSKHAEDFEKGYYSIHYPLALESRTATIKYNCIFLGGVKMDSRGYVQSSKAISLWYILNFADTSKDEVYELWEDKLTEILKSYKSDLVEVLTMTSDSLIKEMSSTMKYAIPFLIMSVLLAVIFAVGTNHMADWTLSKPWLGVLSVVTALLGIASAFGIGQLMGYPLLSFHIIIVLMIIAIGLDDTFVLVAAWRETPSDQSVEQRLSDTYDRTGVAITLTSLTNIASFCSGVFAPFPVTFIFSIYAALSALMCYFSTLCFFGGCLALYGRAEEKRLHALTCRHRVVPKSLAGDKSFLFRLLCTGGKNADDPDNPVDNQEHFATIFFRDYYAKFIFSRNGMILSALAYLLYLTLAVYGAMNFDVEFDERLFLNTDSHISRFLSFRYSYFKDYQQRIQVVFDQKLNYSDEVIQKQLEHVLQTFETDTNIASRQLTESWLRQYLHFLETTDVYRYWRGYDCKSQHKFIYCLKEIFLKLKPFQRFKKDIVFSENGTEITASRFFLVTQNIDEGNRLIDLEVKQQAVNATSEIKMRAFFYYMFFLIEHYFLLMPVLFSSVSIAIGLMAFLSLLFIPRLDFAVVVVLTILSVEMGLFGFLSLHSIKLNTVNMIYFIISIGFSVDNAAHVMWAYSQSPGETSFEKMQDSLSHMGFPIMQGSLSSLIIPSPILFLSSPIYRDSGIFMLYLFTLSIIHSVCFIPLGIYMHHAMMGFGRRREFVEDGSALKTLTKPRSQS